MSIEPKEVEPQVPESVLEDIREKAKVFRRENPEVCKKLNRRFREHRRRKIFGRPEKGSEENKKTSESNVKTPGRISVQHILKTLGGDRPLSSILDL